MKIKKKNFVWILVVCFLLGSFLTIGIIGIVNGGLDLVFNRDNSYMKYMTNKYAKAEGIMQGIEKNYYKDVKEDEIMTMMYRGIVAGLDDKYSEYLTKEEFEGYKTEISGEFEGVGATFKHSKKSEFTIVSIEKKSPSEKMGLKKGDIITKVDDKKYTDITKLGNAIRGEKNTKVKITYKRNGKENSVIIVRDKIETHTVETKTLKNNVAYIKIKGFEENTYKEFKAELNKIETSNARGFIIDLRDNGGGLVDSAVKISDEILGKSTITYIRNKEGKQKEYTSDSNKTQLPYVVLVNEYTASASEIITAAVLDNGTGDIVGKKTYGKGVIQSTTGLKEGDAVKLTVMEYYSPKGKRIHTKGITPNYVIKDREKQLEKAIKLLS